MPDLLTFGQYRHILNTIINYENMAGKYGPQECTGTAKEECSMFSRNDFPVLEFDDNPTAKLNPINFVDKKFGTDRMVITFFPEVVNQLAESGQITEERLISGENPLWFTALRSSPMCC